ncbi:MAG: phosphatidylserine decarboxylase family protein [Bacteroidales bacterium]|nr:phosphatidylserine decarboxylase family protein [Bacteroidales bacterium]
MKIHKEGILIILTVLTLLTILNLVVHWSIKNSFLQTALATVSVVLFLLVLWFFRDPGRKFVPDALVINCPADGEIVAIKEVFENEYFHDKRIQVSIFMSPLNVHINRYPVNGFITYVRYHPGKYLVAWHPKSSELNEHATVVLKDRKGREIMVRQIAGAVARRIVTYAEEGMDVVQGQELGFIKFGSRVDLFLPAGTAIDVEIGQKVKGNQSVVGRWKEQ